MKKLILSTTGILFIIFSAASVRAQNNKPYKDGSVWLVSFVQTKPGMGDICLKDLSTHWVKMGEAAKAQGLVMDYKVLSANPAAKTDWDLMLMIEIKNYAALDGLNDKMDALALKLFGSEDTLHTSAVSRNDMRDLLGGKLTRELIFK